MEKRLCEEWRLQNILFFRPRTCARQATI